MRSNASATVSDRVAVIVDINASSKYQSPSELQMLAYYFLSALNANFRAGTACRFFSVKRKLRTLSSPFS
jgi:hypothetical protein